MAGTDVRILLGAFMGRRISNPDTSIDPFSTEKAFIDVVNPIPDLTLSQPAVIPFEPPPRLSTPAGPIPFEPPPPLSTPGTIAFEPAPPLTSPATLLPEPSPPLIQAASLAFQPPPPFSVPAALPPELPPPLSQPGVLPPPPPVNLSVPAQIAQQPFPALYPPKPIPNPPPVTIVPTTPAPPMGPAVSNIPGRPIVFNPNPFDNSDVVLTSFFSTVDILRQISSNDRVIQADLRGIANSMIGFTQQLRLNKYGPSFPYAQNAVMVLGDLIEDILTGANRMGVLTDDPLTSTGLQRVAFATGGTIGPGIVNGNPARLGIVNLFTGNPLQLASPTQWDPLPGLAKIAGRALGFSKLEGAAFPHGIIPAKFAHENQFGFSVFNRGNHPKIGDDEAYVPLSFTDLRPVGQIYRTVYFRPFITSFAESFSPQWNKSHFHGRVDPVVTYQATGRTISLGFKMAAFGPEDVRVIWNKLNWLASMVYPEYDSDLQFVSGPVVRMRVGDAVNAIGPEGGFGLPGIIESMEFDYGDAIWELKKDLKVPRNIDVSLTFLVLHDMPIGRGAEGKFGGIGTIDDRGLYQPPGQANPGAGSDATANSPQVKVGANAFRKMGEDIMNSYDTLGGADGLGFDIFPKF